MDIHRARFIPYPTPSISCLAFTRSNDIGITSHKPALRLALARTDGSIEIWNPSSGIWVQETVFPSAGNDAVDSLVWTQEPDEVANDGEIIAGQYRLFSIGSSASVTEWDLETGTVKRRSTGNFSEVWCLAAQPRNLKPSTIDEQTPSQNLVIGCGDGTLALLTTDDNDLQFKRFLARVSGKKARCLTVTYQKPEVVVAGFADSMIRVFDTRNGTILRTMSLGVGLPGAPKTTLVWKLSCLPNKDLISADSNGELRIWDGKTLSMRQRLSGHEGDCLDIVVSSDGKTILSGGVDGRLACFQRTIVDRGRTTWAKISHRKIHQEHGPVRVLSAFDSKNMSVLVAGGGAPAPVVVPMKAFGTEHMRALPYLPQEAQVVSAPAARYIATWWDTTVFIYRFARHNSLEVIRDEHKASRQLVAKIKIDSQQPIRSVTLSPNGALVAVSTSTSTKLFQLASQAVSEGPLKVRKVKLPKEMAETGARQLAIASPDLAEGAWLAAVSLDNEIRLTKIIWTSIEDAILEAATMAIELERPVRRSNDRTGFKKYNSTINQLEFTEDGSLLVTGDLVGNLDYWEVNGDFDIDQKCIEVSKNTNLADDDSDSDSSDDEDTTVVLFGQTWQYGKSNPLPRLDSTPLVLTFRPVTEQNLINSQLGESAVPPHQRLVIITARHQMYEFDVREGKLSGWSRRNPSSSLPQDFTKIRDRVMGAHWDPQERLWLYGSNFVFMLDVSTDLSSMQSNVSSKRKRQEDTKMPSKRNKGSGAGGLITNGHDTGGPHTARMTDEQQKLHRLDLRGVAEVDIDDDEDNIELGLVRRPSTHEADNTHEHRLQLTNKKHGYWSTFKYRPILGMVPLANDGRQISDLDEALEVVIVERPPIPVKKTGKQK